MSQEVADADMGARERGTDENSVLQEMIYGPSSEIVELNVGGVVCTFYGLGIRVYL